MATFVLVHGAAHGGWCWQATARLLRKAGHEVYTPTLTGLGERVHLLTPDVYLATHTQDIANVLDYEDLRDVVLVGHSFAGVILPRIALARPKTLRHLVWLDGTVQDEGESFFGTPPWNWDAERCEQIIERVRAGKMAVANPAPDANGMMPNGQPMWPGEFFCDIEDAGLRSWVLGKITGQPIITQCEPMHAPGFEQLGIPITFVYCTRNHTERGIMNHERAKGRGWPVVEVDAGHDVMVTHPEVLAGVLESIAGRQH